MSLVCEDGRHFSFGIGAQKKRTQSAKNVRICVRKVYKPLIINVYCGAGGNRTFVQTGKPYAFYTLILDFDFRISARPKPPTDTLAPKFHPCVGARRDYSRFNLRRWIFGSGTTSSERRLVLLPGKRIKLVIYYASIKQRERSCFRQLIC